MNQDEFYADQEIWDTEFDDPNAPVIELSPAEDKYACCGMLLIQAHTPSCDGRVRSSRPRFF